MFTYRHACLHMYTVKITILMWETWVFGSYSGFSSARDVCSDPPVPRALLCAFLIAIRFSVLLCAWNEKEFKMSHAWRASLNWLLCKDKLVLFFLCFFLSVLSFCLHVVQIITLIWPYFLNYAWCFLEALNRKNRLNIFRINQLLFLLLNVPFNVNVIN